MNISVKVDIIFLIIASEDNYYNNFVTNFWLPFIRICEEREINIKFIFMYGKHKNINNLIPSKYLLETNIVEERIPGCLDKTILGYKHVLQNYDFNYIFRCNLSAFIIIDKFLEFYDIIKNNDYYIGCPVSDHGCKEYIDEFMSGAGFLTSKKYSEILLKDISEDKHLYPFKKNLKPLRSLPDDVAVGIILENKKKYITKRLDISSEIFWQSGNETIFNNRLLPDKDIQNIIDICNRKKIFHIRFKTENREFDAINMKKLFQYYYTKNISEFPENNEKMINYKVNIPKEESIISKYFQNPENFFIIIYKIFLIYKYLKVKKKLSLKNLLVFK
jgi:hypothetical protein